MKKFLSAEGLFSVKLTLLLVLNSQFLFLHSYSQSPDWQWAKSMGGTNEDQGLSIAVDPTNGDVYTTGLFEGTADFDPGAGVFNLTAVDAEDIFISKLDGSGNFVWAIAMGGTGSDIGSSIAIDKEGTVYVTGHFVGTADFDPGAAVFNLTSSGSDDIFISKLNSSGNLIWAKAMGGSGSDYGNSIAIDPTGNGDVYTTGNFGGTADLDPGAGIFNLTSAGVQDIFISKLDSAGNFIWAKGIGGGIWDIGYAIAFDPAGSGGVYTTGKFEATVDFDPGAGVCNLVSSSGGNIFISKFDGSGNFIWAKAMARSGTYYDVGFSIAIDTVGSGDVYTTGRFGGTVDFDPSNGTFNLIASGIADIFISRLDSSGNFIWAKAMGGPGDDGGSSIAVASSGKGDVYTTGYFGPTADFDPGAGIFNLTSIVGLDSFFSKLDSLGNFVWAKAIGGTNMDGGKSIAIDAFDNVHVTGYFTSPFITFDSDTLTNAGNYEIFIAKLDTTVITRNSEIENFDNGILLFPNPATNHFTITLGNIIKNVEVIVTDITGKVINTTTATTTQKVVVNTEQFEEGVYVVIIKAAEFIETKRFIVAK